MSQERDTMMGALAGFLGGLALSTAMQLQGTAGLLGLHALDLGPSLSLIVHGVHLLSAVVLGTGFGAIFRYQPNGYASIVSSGLLYGLLWWIAGPLTLKPFVLGQGPLWSLEEAVSIFPSLIGHLLYGGITALSFHAFTTLYLWVKPESQCATVSAEKSVKRIVILGGGFGGVSAAQHLGQLLARDSNVEITLVSQSNYLLFTPMLAEVASGGLEPQHISAPIRAVSPRTHFLRAEAEAIDTATQVVQVRTAASAPLTALAYHHLILALGAIPNYFSLPGVETNSFTLKTLQDATRLRNHVISLLESADIEPDADQRRRQLTFVVAGAGFAGTEMIVELFDFIHSSLHFYPHIRAGELRLVLVHAGDRILPELSADLGAYALQKLQARGIEFLLNARIAGAMHESVLLNDGRQIPTFTLVWTAGNQPHPLVKTLPCEHNKSGAVVTESTMRVKGSTNLWAVGDCAQIPDVLSEGKFHPPTAQHALREGRFVAENVAAALRGQPIRPFRFRTLGILVVLGRRTAVAEIRGRKFSGLFAWFLWRMIYLNKLPGLEKKVRVALDWVIELFFPRDIVLAADTTAPTLTPAMKAHRGRRPSRKSFEGKTAEERVE